MHIDEFDILGENERYHLVFTEGNYIDHIIESDIRFVLFSLFLFWVEVSYDPLDNKITGMKSFATGPLLDRYSNSTDSY
ncbi:hypothetical protein [Maribacter polysaccharolyticus]|uniref:hypothetical protein n=1 Tax=Maribacter polysaccharolyticus TaxID=3020831 RepID=UPI00237F4E9B|nr:hypothetical protein [Maribacter polysaccharolyticus]MDE3744007.1 hypothetical protein [Maribacter polysaccharolyticus]